MIVDKLVGKLQVRSNFIELIPSSILTALAIALGMVGILTLFSFSINPAVVLAALGAIGGAIYAVVTCK